MPEPKPGSPSDKLDHSQRVEGGGTVGGDRLVSRLVISWLRASR